MQTTRRTIVTQAAGALAITALPVATAAATIDPADPAFALIKAHQLIEHRYHSLFDADPVPQAELEQLSDEVWDASWDLADCRPTTLQGVVAVLRYVAIDEDGTRWPVAGESDENWWRALDENLAAAIEKIKGGNFADALERLMPS